MKKRLSTLTSALLIVVTLFTLIPPTVSAANPVIMEQDCALLYNVYTEEYLNFDFGTLKNGTIVRCWPADGSTEQLWKLVFVKSGVYRLVTYKNSSYCLDIYRGTAKLKTGQKTDIWKTGDDITAQNIVLYQCNNSSWILRMESDTNLVIASSGSKSQCKLKSFDCNDKSQQWQFRNKDGDIIDISTNNNSSGRGIPYSSYIKTGVYTVDGKTFYEAKTVKEYNGVVAGSTFYVSADGSINTDAATLNKLLCLTATRDLRSMMADSAQSYIDAALLYRNLYYQITANESLGSLIGKTSGVLVSLLSETPIALADVLLEDLTSPETAKAAVLAALIAIYSHNIQSYATTTISLLNNENVDYQDCVNGFESYKKAVANYAALSYLVGNEIEGYANTTVNEKLGEFFFQVICGFSDSIFPSISSAELMNQLTEGTTNIIDLAVKTGAESAYVKRLNELSAKYSQMFALTFPVDTALKLSSVSGENSSIKEKLDKLINGSEVLHYGSATASAKTGDRYNDFNSSSLGIQCFGFCQALTNELYGEQFASAYFAKNRFKLDVDDTKVETVFSIYRPDSVSKLKDYLSKASVGDLIQMSSPKTQHTMLVYSIDDRGVTVYDANWDLKNTIQLHKLSYESIFSFIASAKEGISLYRAR